MGYWDGLVQPKQQNTTQVKQPAAIVVAQPAPAPSIKVGVAQPTQTVTVAKKPIEPRGAAKPLTVVGANNTVAPTPTPDKGGGFWSGLVKAPIQSLVVKPAVRTTQAVIAPSQIMTSRANSQIRNELAVTQNKLALAFRNEKDPVKRNRLATQIAENQRVLDQQGVKGETAQRAIDKLYSDTTVNLPGAGDFTVSGQKSGKAGIKQIAGETLEAASYIYGGQGLTRVGANLVKNAVAQAAISSGVIGTVGGGALGLAQSLQENAGVKETLINTTVSAAIGGAGGAILGTGGALAAKGFDRVITQSKAHTASLVKEFIAQGYSPAKAQMMAEQGGFLNIGGKFNPKLEDALNSGNLAKAKAIVAEMAPDDPYKSSMEAMLNRYKATSVKELGLITTVKNSPTTAPQVKSALQGEYTISHNKPVFDEALRIVNNNSPDVAYKIATQTKYSARSSAVGQELIIKYQNEGRFEQAIDLVEVMAERAKDAGQYNQAFAAYNRLTPEGVLRFAQRQFHKAGEHIKPGISDDIAGIVDKVSDDFTAINKTAIDTVVKEIPDLTPIPKSKNNLDKAISKRSVAPEFELASRITPFLKTKTHNPVKEMLNTLYKLASEQLPKKGKTVPKDSITLIGQALRDKNTYKDVWLKAQDIVRDNYKDNPQAIQLLDKYFDKTLLSGIATHADLPVAQSQINSAVRQELTAQKVNLSKVVRDFYTVNQQAGKDLTKELIKKAHVPAEESVALASKIQNRFDELVAAKKDAVLSQFLKTNKINIPKTQAQKIIEISNLGGFDKDSLSSAISAKLGVPRLDATLAKRLTEQARLVQRLPEGRSKEVATGLMLKMINDQVPVSWGRKVSAIQTMAQLLNPKTFIRNIGGNTGFAVLENISDVVGTPLDKAVSLFTGKRTKGLPNVGVQLKNFNKGAREGAEDALLGINTGSTAGAKFDLPHSKVFKGKILGSAEKLLNLSLRAPDRGGYEAAFQNSIANQMKFAKVANPTDEMIHIANLDGLYRTFNDDSVAAQAFSKIKNALNTLSSPITGKDWGLGDAVLKYPKTPGNLLARGVDYSPAGFLKSLTQLARPLVGKEFNQKAFVESTSRALVGSTGLVGTGAILHKLDIITGKPEKDADMNALQRATGLGQYKMNVSALKRFVFSGFDPSEAKLKEGDKLLSYDWM